MEEKKSKKNIITNTKQVKGRPLRIWLVVMIIIFMLFTFGIGIYCGVELVPKANRKETVNIVTEDKKEKEEKKESSVPVEDSFAFVGESLYFIHDGDVYYYSVIDSESTKKWGHDIFSLTHSGCIKDNNDDYCKLNPPYDNKAEKVEGISNVKKLKVFNKLCSTDERFDVFAITEDGNIYNIEKTTSVKFLGENDVEDMTDIENHRYYEITLKNGKHMIYSVSIDNTTDRPFECKPSYEEKK